MTRMICIAICLFTTANSFADDSKQAKDADHKAVERACLDYVEAFYQVKPELIERSVHKELKKFGYWRNPESGEYRGMAMTYQQLYDLATTFNKNGRVPKDAPKEVKIFEVMDKTASAKLVAYWGIDYFQLIKEDGKWKILQVVWQSAPEKK